MLKSPYLPNVYTFMYLTNFNISLQTSSAGMARELQRALKRLSSPPGPGADTGIRAEGQKLVPLHSKY